MATESGSRDEEQDPWVAPPTRFLSANGNVVRYDFDAPDPPEQRVVAVEGDTARILAIVTEDAPAESFENVLDDLATELSFAAGEDVDP